MSEQPTDAQILLIRNISKHFGGIQALSNISMDIRYGEVHALVGENGAGKSTLMNILGGIVQRDSGEVFFEGSPVVFANPMQSLQAGIAIIHQELAMLPTLNVVDNMFMGRMKTRYGILPWRDLEQKSREYMQTVGLDLDPRLIVRNLTVSQCQLIEIAKAVSMDASLIIMDEPNSSLAEAETEILFNVIRKLVKQNVTVIYVSHKINEVIEISDRISVLRDGKLIGTVNTKAVGVDDVVEMMAGRKIHIERIATKITRTKPVLEVQHLSGEGFHDISFDLYPGEILGFAGLVGAGRSELARAVFGDSRIHSGKVLMEGKPVHFNIPSEAIQNGISMVQEDRKVLSLFMDHSILSNMSIAYLPNISILGFIRGAKERLIGKEYTGRLNIKISSLSDAVRNLSGGNQQKTVLSRWLATHPKVLILDQPTHGIDVGAKAEISELMRKLAQQGMGIILISDEIPEIQAMADRIAVMHEGRLTGILEHKDADESKIMALAMNLN